jgi:hypothetical protein
MLIILIWLNYLTFFGLSFCLFDITLLSIRHFDLTRPIGILIIKLLFCYYSMYIIFDNRDKFVLMNNHYRLEIGVVYILIN